MTSTNPSDYDPDCIGMTRSILDREIVHLDREEALHEVWRFVYHLKRSAHPAGLMFLCGENIHGLKYFAKRLALNGGSEVFAQAKDLGIGQHLPDIERFRCAPGDPVYSENRSPLLAAVQQIMKSTGVDGIPPDDYPNLASIYQATESAEGSPLFFFALRVKSKGILGNPPRKIAEEFRTFVADVKGTQEGRRPGVIFLFAVIVDGSESGQVKVNRDNEDLATGIFVELPEIVVKNTRDYPIEGESYFWGISSWENVGCPDVDKFLDNLAARTLGQNSDGHQLKDDIAKIQLDMLERLKEDTVPVAEAHIMMANVIGG